MRSFNVATALAVLALSGSSFAASAKRATSNPAAVTGTRKASILANITGLGATPSVAAAAGLNTDNIQGDILIGMKKQEELFYFFGISNVSAFQSTLLTEVVPIVTTTTQLLSVSTQPLVALNIAFSQSGVTALGITDSLGDALYSAGQATDATTLGDPGTTNWVPAFVGTTIHGVFLLASDTDALLQQQVTQLETAFGSSMVKLYTLQGNVRPGAEAGHEMFGFLDGISQPHVDGFGTANPGQLTVSPGVILVGETGDTVTRPASGWMTDGSFLAFRQLEQLVPEFNKFLLDNAPAVDNFTQQQAADLLGARMVGRWKSGAPVDLTPLADDPVLGADPSRNNNFDFSHVNFTETVDQTHCPFSAHIRKTHPRADLSAPANSIIRAGIPYGPEVTDAEAASNTTTIERGLAFVCYQSQLAKGFHFLQHTWANNPNFIFGRATPPGFDPIIGANNGQSRMVSGQSLSDPTAEITLTTDLVVSHGGEYFFSPSITALQTIFSGSQSA